MNFQKLANRFIVLDGPDGSGKSTQIRRLAEYISGQGIACSVFRDPGGTNIGEQIRHILLDKANANMSVRCEALLYMASRAQLYNEAIAPALKRGHCVLCDRWLSSTLAYQAAGGKLGAAQVLAIAQAALERIWPDVTILLDLPSEAGLQRLGREPDRMELKGGDFHQCVREAFLELARGRNDFHVVSAEGAEQQVRHRIQKVIENYVAS